MSILSTFAEKSVDFGETQMSFNCFADVKEYKIIVLRYNPPVQ